MDVKTGLQQEISHCAERMSKLFTLQNIANSHPEMNLRAGWIDFDPHDKLRVVLFTDNQRRDQKLFGGLTKYGFLEHGENLVGEGEDYILTLAPLSESVSPAAMAAQGATSVR